MCLDTNTCSLQSPVPCITFASSPPTANHSARSSSAGRIGPSGSVIHMSGRGRDLRVLDWVSGLDDPEQLATLVVETIRPQPISV